MKYTLIILALVSLTGCDSRFASYQPMEIKITKGQVGYSVESMDCPPMDITPKGKVYEGCAVENSRFQSMVHPEKMLPEAQQP